MSARVQPRHHGACLRLLETGILSKSGCGQSLIRALKPLFDSGVVRWEKAGGGQRLVVANPSGFGRWFLYHFPDIQFMDEASSSRVRALAKFRDSKALPSDLPELVCLRSARDGCLLRDGLPVATTSSSKEHGVFAFVLGDLTPYSLKDTCALIENLALFHSFEKLGLDLPIAIHTGRFTSNRFLTWLASSVESGLRIVHLPDYDPFGLTEFLRIHERLGDAVTLHVPSNLTSIFRTYSKRSLLEKPKSQRMLIELRKSKHPAVRRIVELMDESNAGQEHEAMLLSGKAQKKSP